MDDLERLLNKYRLAGPPEDLRQRIVEASVPSPQARMREWLLPLGAAAAALILYARAAALRHAYPTLVDDARPHVVAHLAEELGGDHSAREMARRIVDEEERRERQDIARMLNQVPDE